jgi:hypothetical protein
MPAEMDQAHKMCLREMEAKRKTTTMMKVCVKKTTAIMKV